MKHLKVALIHDWLVGFGGAEQVLLALHEMFPDAPIYTSLYDREKLPEKFSTLNIIPSGLQKFPGAISRHRLFLPFMPLAFEQFDLSSFDLIISSSHACAKGVITSPSTCHISYVHSPMRYAWDMFHSYMEGDSIKGLKRGLTTLILHYLRMWDQLSAMRVDYYACNSTIVQKRISKYYGRNSKVIFPPVNIENYLPDQEKKPYYLVFSRLVAYKRVDLAIKAFNQLGYPLKVIGIGPQLKQLQKMAKANIEFLGFVTEKDKWHYLSTAKGLVFPGLEDFGIIPVEAQSVGCPVIAYFQGGVQDTVLANETGVFFSEQSVESLKAAIIDFEQKHFKTADMLQHVKKFSSGLFIENMYEFVETSYQSFVKK